MRKVIAFTLAETLITMTIIGVIAALTIPSLVNRYQQKSFDTAKAKFVSELSQGFTRYLADKNTNDLKYTPFATANGKRSFFDNYFKSATKCGNTLDDCFAADYIDTNGTALAQMNTLCNDAYTLKDGASVCIMAKDGWDGKYYDARTKKNENYLKVYYDINGKNKPNIFGRDYYVSNIVTDGSLIDNPAAPHSTTPSDTTPSDTTPSDTTPTDTTPSDTTPAYTVPKYKLTVTTAATCGTVDGSGTYAEGEKIEVGTYPSTGHEFSSLSPSGCSASGNVVTMGASDCNVVANCKSTLCSNGLPRINGKCFSKAFYPTGLSTSECNQASNNGELGVSYTCRFTTDRWAGAAKTCGGIDKMPTPSDLTALAEYVYDSSISSSGSTSGLTLNNSHVNDFLDLNLSQTVVTIMCTC
jgi:Tfp pilus assembly protein PilE